MKIAFINGSPKLHNSSSESIILALKSLLPEEYMLLDYGCRKKQVVRNEKEEISKCKSLVIAFPLYVDGIPSQLLGCLEQMETYFKKNPNPNLKVYAIVNCGFYEGRQGSIALEMVENWCVKAGLTWGQGLGIGGGGMLASMSATPNDKGPNRNLVIALNTLANSIKNSSTGENIFITPNMPRFVYKMGGDYGWNKQIKSNGLTKKDLFIRQ